MYFNLIKQKKRISITILNETKHNYVRFIVHEITVEKNTKDKLARSQNKQAKFVSSSGLFGNQVLSIVAKFNIGVFLYNKEAPFIIPALNLVF
jgi:hypothetical protein